MAAVSRLPETFRKAVISQLSTNYREAVKFVDVPMVQPGPNDVLVKNRFLGVNATDINHSAGRYDPGQPPPFNAGLEGVGQVVAVGENCKDQFKEGEAVGYIGNGAYSEFIVLPRGRVLPLPKVDAAYTSLLISGLTASICLKRVGEIKKGETVLITAAAGGTGQFAVQLAKLAGCHVIGTCSTDSKAQFLKSLGCDRPINYKTEDVKAVLKGEYPRGIDVVYESIGGDMFDTCLDGLAHKGRLVSIGFITGYSSKLGFTPVRTASIVPKLLMKSASVRGFMLPDFLEDYRDHLATLVDLHTAGKLHCLVDQGKRAEKGPFRGVDSVVDAVEYLHSGKSSGKVVVDIPDPSPSSL